MATFDPTTPEVWYPIPGFPTYQISSHLRAKSFHTGPHRNNRRAARIIKIHHDDRGYGKLLLWRDRKYHNLYLHRLVAELAYGPIPQGAYVRHLDDDKSNNWPPNLAIGTAAENVADSKRNGTHATARGEDYKTAKLSDLAVRAIRRLIDYGVCDSVLAECFEMDRSILTRIKLGERWSHVV